MKKLVSLILIFMVIMTISIAVFATDVLGDGNNTTTITGNEYQNAQQNDVLGNNSNNNNTSALPQTGTQDYVAAILFVVFATGAIFAYKKVSDYRDI